ncbi:MAG: hypothetical protein HKN29_16325 [Rhodothermales bacterium]|nr:hypothetical protein [Rhodothermales bacterium]
MRITVPILTLAALLVSGCAASNPVATPVDAGVETVVFTTESERVTVVDVATALLVQHDFTITLANERLGLLQTDYASVAGIAAMRPDTGLGHVALEDLYVRLTVNSEDRDGIQIVQVKGNFQRMAGGRSPDRLIGLYWMEQLTSDMARALDADYVARVSDEIYDQALSNVALPTPAESRSGQINKGLRAVGIVGAILFAATLAASTFAPSASR